MNILVINGSPKGTRSNTYRLTKAFLEGIAENDCETAVEELTANRLNMKPCLGCFSCWNKTPGRCCMEDDMQEVLQKILWADVTIWSFPLYFFSLPGALKVLMDRQLPLSLPFMSREDENGSGSHPARYDMSGKRTVVISTCGFYTAKGNYEGVTSVFDHLCGKGGYETIFCGQGELFRVPELSGRTGEYLEFVRQAGKEFGSGGISEETRARLEELLYPREIFESMADASWGIDKETGEKASEVFTFTKQMAALYRKGSCKEKAIVFDIYYTDVEERYQITLDRDKSEVVKDGTKKADTIIETPFTVWRSIATGELRGDEALMKHMYKVKGDFELMLHWDDYFIGSSENTKEGADSDGKTAAKGDVRTEKEKPTNMTIFLLPWIVFWVTAAIDGYLGGVISITVCALTPLLFFKNQKTIYDILSGVLVTGLSTALIMGAQPRLVVPLAYLLFGVIWSVSCLGKIPLTAHYSKNSYNGEKALKNPLFMKTNRILTLAWGVLYLLTPIWTYAIMGTKISSWAGAINSILPMGMGLFTAWFQKWYPARIARG